jgi:hypothetical protein
MQKRNKKAAIELSINTIVIIVLAMSMLILGLVLIKNLFGGADDVIKLTNDQVISKINEQFGSEEKVAIYPITEEVTIKQGKQGGFALVIRNQLTGASSQNAKFSYTVKPASDIKADCGISEAELMSFFVAGSDSDKDIPIATGEPLVKKILLQTQKGDPLCTVQFRIDVTNDGNNYKSKYVFVKFTD